LGYKRLFILVEGSDDTRFFEHSIKPLFEAKYDVVQIIAYARMKKEKVKGWLASIEAMKADCIFAADINSDPCVTQKKKTIVSEWGVNVAKARMVVVIKEIESWYLAGVTDARCKTLKLKLLSVQHTNNITKEKFNSMIPKRFDSRIDFLLELLKRYSVPTAKRKNRSFSYFYDKHIA